MSQSKRNCSNCRYADVLVAGKSFVCRRKAPLPITNYDEEGMQANYAHWPIVFPNDWCGEYRRRLSK